MIKHKHEIKEAALVFIIVLAFITFLYFLNPSPTGHVISDLHSDLNDFTLSYDNNFINSSGNEFKLKPSIQIMQLSNQNYSYYEIEKAYFNAADKLDKINQDDNKEQSVQSNEIFNVIFANNLNNNDAINVLIKAGSAGDFWLCDINEICSSPGYGLASYNGSDDASYTITLSNLGSSENKFNIVVPGSIQFDFISSSQGSISYAYHNPEDKIGRLNSKDNQLVDMAANKLLDIKFDSQVNNNDIINLYIKGSSSTYYICEASTFCDSSNYGSLNYQGQEGWYSITMQNLNSGKQWFNIAGTSKIDYVNITHPFLTYYNITNISYTESSITTDDLSFNQEVSSGRVNYSSNGNVSYYYSTDSGESWNAIADNVLSISSDKIRFKITLHNENSTFYNLSLDYQDDIPTSYNITNSGYINILEGNATIINNTNTLIYLRTNDNVYNGLINITENVNHTSKLNIFKDIKIDDSIKNSLINATIRFYYTDEQLESFGLDEESLNIGFYNETSSTWVFLDSFVNKEENYVEITVNHFSVYGLFGEEKQEQSSSSGASGASRRFAREEASANETVSEENIETQSVESPLDNAIENEQTNPTPLTGRAISENNNGRLTSTVIITAILILAVIGLLLYARFKNKKKFNR